MIPIGKNGALFIFPIFLTWYTGSFLIKAIWGNFSKIIISSKTHRFILGLADDNGVPNHGDKAVDVGAKVELDHVSVGEDCVRLRVEGTVVADDVVDCETGGEGNTWTR